MALATTYEDMQRLHKFSSHLLTNEKTIMTYMSKLMNDFTYFSNEQRLLTLYIEMTSSNLMQDKIVHTQLDILQLNNIYNELNSFVNNIISIGNGDKRLIIQGQIFHVNEHNYICNADQLKCVWDIDARILNPVSVHKRKCKAFYNGVQVLISSQHDKLVDQP